MCLHFGAVDIYIIHNLIFPPIPQDVPHEGIYGTVKGLITSCTYAGWDCTDPAMWEPFQDSKYGNCFTFNNDPESLRNSSLTGLSNGDYKNTNSVP